MFRVLHLMGVQIIARFDLGTSTLSRCDFLMESSFKLFADTHHKYFARHVHTGVPDNLYVHQIVGIIVCQLNNLMNYWLILWDKNSIEANSHLMTNLPKFQHTWFRALPKSTNNSGCWIRSWIVCNLDYVHFATTNHKDYDNKFQFACYQISSQAQCLCRWELSVCHSPAL